MLLNLQIGNIMQKTSKGLIVSRVAVPDYVWQELYEVGMPKGKTPNNVIKSILTKWADKRVKEREELDAIFKLKHFANTGERLWCFSNMLEN